MKRFLALFAFVSVCVAANAQLNVTYTSGKEDVIVKGGDYGSLRYSHGSYSLHLIDRHTGQIITFALGDTKEAAVKTMEDLFVWHKDAKNKSYIEVEDSRGMPYTLGKQGGYLYITDGTGEYIRSYYRDMVWTNVFNVLSDDAPVVSITNRGQYDMNTPKIGYITNSLLKKGIKRLTK